jgi:hypothetical protein
LTEHRPNPQALESPIGENLKKLFKIYIIISMDIKVILFSYTPTLLSPFRG